MSRQNVRQKSRSRILCECFTPTLPYHHYFIAFPEDDRGAENLVRAGRFLNACLDSIVQEALEKRNS